MSTTAVSAPVPSTGVAAGSETYDVAGGRTFLLHTPGPTAVARPLVVALHPAAHVAADFEATSGLSAYADAEGFDVAYGAGIDGVWNAGGCCGSDTVDDLGYLQAVVDRVAELTPVDRSRVYVIGFSNGGMMAYRAVCELPSVFVAAGVVAGALMPGVQCAQTNVWVYRIHGAADLTVPLDGGIGYHGYDFPPQSSDQDRIGPASVLGTHVWPGGHVYPPWATAELWQWLEQWSAAP